MQRLFSTFPEGRPGIGLVFLRAVTAMPLVQLMAALPPTTLPASLILQSLAAASSALLMVGLWTPVAGFVMAIAELSLAVLQFSDAPMHIVLAALGGGLAMIGPGAWSLDARLFGRKRIRVPQS